MNCNARCALELDPTTLLLVWRLPRVVRDGYSGNNDGIASRAGYSSHVIHCQKSAALCVQGYVVPGEAAGNRLGPLFRPFASRRLKKRPWFAISLSLEPIFSCGWLDREKRCYFECDCSVVPCLKLLSRHCVVSCTSGLCSRLSLSATRCIGSCLEPLKP